MQRTIDRIQLGEGTAIGEAVFSALDVFANLDGEAEGDEVATTSSPARTPPNRLQGDALTGAVVLLSDGETTQGRSNDEAAKAALAQGVAVNTIAFGTDAGVVTGPDGVADPRAREPRRARAPSRTRPAAATSPPTPRPS